MMQPTIIFITTVIFHVTEKSILISVLPRSCNNLRPAAYRPAAYPRRLTMLLDVISNRTFFTNQ